MAIERQLPRATTELTDEQKQQLDTMLILAFQTILENEEG
ncbi:hypothetical protein GGR27_000314 [Lewinella antarctica]|uniref:Uncharacterized protein n=1 Tax=Neolewinella antarctica TaxID=442734 RepID=A0ABX0X6K3_9BACT|nr:hypothetical protein [Neolewinella antarctica]